MKSYVQFEIQEGAYDISCPDAQCEKQGVISLAEIDILVSKELVEKHHKFRLNRGKCWSEYEEVKIEFLSHKCSKTMGCVCVRARAKYVTVR